MLSLNYEITENIAMASDELQNKRIANILFIVK